MLQGEFEFGEMRKTGHVVAMPRAIKISIEERDRMIVDLRKNGFFYNQIKERAVCSDATITKVLRRDAPDLLARNKLKDPPKKDPRSEGQLLALPPTNNEPRAKLGVHFWNIGFSQCRYIVAKDPDDNLARFCGEQTVGSCSWCADHLKVVAQPKRKFIAEAA